LWQHPLQFDDLVNGCYRICNVLCAFTYRLCALFHGGHGLLCTLLDIFNQSCYLVGSATRFLGEFPYFVSYYGKTTAMLSCARRFYGAFRASKLVWSAIFVMTPIISPISCDLLSSCFYYCCGIIHA